MFGAAMAASVTAAGVASVSLFDVAPGVAATSVSLGGGDRVITDSGDVLKADAVVLAMPVTAILAWLEEFGPRLNQGVLLLDTGSSKQAIVEAMARWVPRDVRAIGGHPMAGGEASGPSAAVLGALHGAVFVLCPCREDQEALSSATALVSACGARPLVIPAREHDRLVARSSHLPHLLASALAEVVAGGAEEIDLVQSLAGTGFRSTTRLAASNSQMVAAFASANRGPLEAALAEFREALDGLEVALARGPEELEHALSRGRAGRALVLGSA